MIELQQERDRRRFIHNMTLAKLTEIDAEDQRVKNGKIPKPRRPLLERLFVALLVKPDGTPPDNH